MHLKLLSGLAFLLAAISIPKSSADDKTESTAAWAPLTSFTLSNQYVTSIARDNQGYIWIGTRRGLNRFNGSIYKVYYQDLGSSLNSDYIQSLSVDSGNRLWVGTNSGINLIQDGVVVRRAKDEFNNVMAIADLDPKKLLYAGNKGLLEYDKQTGSEKRIIPLDKLVYGAALHVTSSGKILVFGIGGKGEVMVLDRAYRKHESIYPDGERGIGTIAEMDDGNLYFSTQDGLKVYSKDLKPLPLPRNLSALTKGREVLFVYSVRGDSTAVIGLKNAGLFEFHSGGSQIKQVWNEETLSGTDRAICMANRDNIWLSKNSDGINYISRGKEKDKIPVPHDLAGEALNKFYPLGRGKLLILTNMRIFLCRLSDMSYEDVTPKDISREDILKSSLIDRRDSSLWLVCNGTSLRKYSFRAARLEAAGYWKGEAFSNIWQDKNGDVLLLDKNCIFNPATSQRSKVEMPSRDINFLFWEKTGESSPYFIDSENLYYLSDKNKLEIFPFAVPRPLSLCEDREGTFWIGTSNSGVFHYNPSDGSSEHYGLGEGFTDTSVRSIQEGVSGEIWVCCRNDVVRISKDGREVSAFGNPDKATYNYNLNSSALLEDGRVLFGCRDAIVVFSPRQVKGKPSIRFSLDVMRVNGRLISDTSKKMVLGYKDNQIAFFFSGMNFDAGSKLYYQYLLDGQDKSWVNSGSGQQVYYSGLHRGNYTFKVRARLDNGEWSDPSSLISFRIMPAPWLSTPALILYFILTVFLFYGTIRQFIRFKLRGERLEMAEQEKRLTEELSKEKSDFFTNISHEFRTPLALIYGPVKDLSRNNSLDDHDKALVGLIERNTGKMMKLTDQILTFNKVGSGGERLLITHTNLSLLLHTLTGNFNYLLQEKSLSLSLDMPETLSLWCDREKVEKIFFNLFSNAIKYTPEGGRISVSARVSEGIAFMEVRDTGIGIDEEMRKKIFLRFSRQKKLVGGKDPGGFGIGLNYAFHLANLHKGTITVRPNVPQGSIFEFSFPAGKEAYPEDEIWEGDIEARPVELPEVKEAVRKENAVMVVDDNHDLREYLRELLSDKYDIIMAADGLDAWEKLQTAAPDIIISDIMMPGMDGFTLCAKIKDSDEFCHIPVILLTAKCDRESQLNGLETGADAYIGKPFDPLILKATVSNIIKNRERMHEALADRTSDTKEDTPEGIDISPRDKVFLDKLYKFMDEHLSEVEFNVSSLSTEMGMSRTSLFSKTKALLGESPQTFITNYRLNKAMDLLKTHDLNVSEVSYRVGFGTLTGFSRSFKNKFGVPPSSV